MRKVSAYFPDLGGSQETFHILSQPGWIARNFPPIFLIWVDRKKLSAYFPDLSGSQETFHLFLAMVHLDMCVIFNTGCTDVT
jgi:hypothetical protein